ncbi:MAG: hypothetical protein F4Y45_16700 [Acidobacteria bacterium]|nr:hypothetical protein [Acidobacteriota bacterium]MYJ05120.1 hypothetical protein [Acidobacteriota bacterium]
MQRARRPAVIAVVSLAAGVSVAPAAAHDCSEPGKSFRINRGVAGYEDCHLTAWVVHYYYPRDHDPKWLALDFAVQGKVGEAMTFGRDEVHVVHPDGSRTPLISQETYLQQRSSLLPLQLQMQGGDRRSPGNCALKLDFFVDRGLRRSLADVSQYRCMQGNLFFAARTGDWERGSYELDVGGGVGLRMPFEIE